MPTQVACWNQPLSCLLLPAASRTGMGQRSGVQQEGRLHFAAGFWECQGPWQCNSLCMDLLCYHSAHVLCVESPATGPSRCISWVCAMVYWGAGGPLIHYRTSFSAVAKSQTLSHIRFRTQGLSSSCTSCCLKLIERSLWVLFPRPEVQGETFFTHSTISSWETLSTALFPDSFSQPFYILNVS